MCAALLSLIHCNSSSSRFLVPFLFVPRTNHSLGSAVCVFSGCNSIAFCIHLRIAFIGIGRYRTNFVNSMQVCSTDSFFFALSLSVCWFWNGLCECGSLFHVVAIGNDDVIRVLCAHRLLHHGSWPLFMDSMHSVHFSSPAMIIVIIFCS